MLNVVIPIQISLHVHAALWRCGMRNANKTVSFYLLSSKANFNYLYKLDKQATRNLILATRQLFYVYFSSPFFKLCPKLAY